MSRWTGKCDFCDSVENGWFNYKTDELYVGGIGPIKLESWEDCIPYYTHITASSGSHSTNLGKESWLDTEEKQSLEWRKKDAKKIFAKYKRKFKREPTEEEFKSEAEKIEGVGSQLYIWEWFYKSLIAKKPELMDYAHLRSYNARRADFIRYAFRHHRARHPQVRMMAWQLGEFDDGLNWEHEIPLLGETKKIWNVEV